MIAGESNGDNKGRGSVSSGEKHKKRVELVLVLSSNSYSSLDLILIGVSGLSSCSI